MSSYFTEDTYEKAIIEMLVGMGYVHLYASDIERDYTSPFLESVLRDSLIRVNRRFPMEAIDEAISRLRNLDSGNLLQKNKMALL